MLLFGPAVIVVGADIMSRDFTRGLAIIAMAVFVTIISSYYRWVRPKNRSRLWLIFPALLSALGYIPLMLLKLKITGTLHERYKRAFPNGGH